VVTRRIMMINPVADKNLVLSKDLLSFFI